MDASGWGGYEGGPPMWNVWRIAAEAQARAGGGQGDSWVYRAISGGMSAGGECIAWVSGSSSAMVGCD